MDSTDPPLEENVMNLNTRRRSLPLPTAAAAVICFLPLAAAAQSQPLPPASRAEKTGVATGVLVGAAAAAATGAWFGDRYHRKAVVARGAEELMLTVRFRTDSVQLEAEDVRGLAQYAEVVAATRGTTIRIAGFADPRGAVAYNQQLSWRRAMAVAQALEAAGVPAARMAIEGKGATAAADGPVDLDGFAFARRVTVSIERS
jgi:outer membrane protein OmpA-like peptidoglycan-associated protein